ncbi:YdcF family protein [Brucella sp. NBRC 12950]|uniref:YdcF family protein n=1 Tax=Brucella sp. NBRC 12950 TaxID=2994518 RepID=UPI0025530F1B|nr:YdcF family protein [Brucella sp. NBRC 12950]
MIDAGILMSMGLFNFGVTLPAFLGLILVLLSLQWGRITGWFSRSRFRRFCWRALLAAFFLWLASLLGYFFLIHKELQQPTANLPSANSILVLGSGTPNCAASSTLQSRLNKALELASNWPTSRIIVSGGVDFGLRCSEASVMADFLAAKGFSTNRIMLEERSTSTDENLRFSANILSANGISLDDTIALVTSDFHVARAMRIARKAGFTSIQGIPAPTPLYLRYNAWLREYFANISGFLLGEY